jgi:predicted Zn-dependent protease
MQNNPRIVPEGWLVQVRGLAQLGRYGEALQLARKVIPPAPLPDFPNTAIYDDDDDARMTAMFRMNPRDMVVATILLKRLLQEESLDKALDTLNMMLDMKPAPPPFVSWWRAQVMDQLGHPDEAWTALQPYLEYQRKLMNQPQAKIITGAEVVLPKVTFKNK